LFLFLFYCYGLLFCCSLPCCTCYRTSLFSRLVCLVAFKIMCCCFVIFAPRLLLVVHALFVSLVTFSPCSQTTFVCCLIVCTLLLVLFLLLTHCYSWGCTSCLCLATTLHTLLPPYHHPLLSPCHRICCRPTIVPYCLPLHLVVALPSCLAIALLLPYHHTCYCLTIAPRCHSTIAPCYHLAITPYCPTITYALLLPYHWALLLLFSSIFLHPLPIVASLPYYFDITPCCSTLLFGIPSSLLCASGGAWNNTNKLHPIEVFFF
jgi:hypothetical protein